MFVFALQIKVIFSRCGEALFSSNDNESFFLRFHMTEQIVEMSKQIGCHDNNHNPRSFLEPDKIADS